MKPIEELAAEHGRGASERTRRECQHYTAIWTIVRALNAVRVNDTDAFDRDLIEQFETARGSITPAEDMNVTGALAHELRAMGALRTRKRAAVVSRR